MRIPFPLMCLLVASGLLAGACGLPANGKKAFPVAVRGVLDLRAWDFERDGAVPLDGAWEWYWDRLLSPSDFTAGPVQPPRDFLSLPRVWNGAPTVDGEATGHGFATFRLRILLPGSADLTRLFALKNAEVGTAFRCYAGEVQVSGAGTVGTTPRTSSPGYLPQVSVPFGVAPEVTILMQVSNFSHADGGIKKELWFGPATTVEKLHDRDLSWSFFIFGGMFIIAFYHFGLYVLRRRDRSPLYFALIALLIAFRTLVSGEYHALHLFPSLSWELMLKGEYLTYYLTLPLFALFTRSLFPHEAGTRPVIFFSILSALFFLPVFATAANFYSHMISWFDVTCLLFGLYITSVVVRAIRGEREGAVIFLCGFIFLFIAGLNDILYGNEIIQTGYFFPVGLWLFILTQSFLLSLRFSKSFASVERLSMALEERSAELGELNRGLEEMVSGRTGELRAALDELAASNENLRAANRQLLFTQRVARMDMDMAINVQRSFLPRTEPVSAEWECAFFFKPMSGVSGDFYDFYLAGGNLRGVGLFDVSGHGIASGLITMIAKSVLYRRFIHGLEKSLGEVMNEANRDLQDEMGGVDNYLSGVMLRFDGSFVEYVNAGHIDIYRTCGERALAVRAADNEPPAGGFLGVPYLHFTYEELRFPVASGEYLLLASDCLAEARNAEDESFGSERIRNAFERSPRGSAHEALDSVMEDFFDFVEDREKLPDDLTVIMIRRL